MTDETGPGGHPSPPPPICPICHQRHTGACPEEGGGDGDGDQTGG